MFRGKNWKLEQWCGFLSEPHDSSEGLEEKFGDNQGIREVHEMLGEFTQDEHLREQYRLREAWLRDQRSVKRSLREYREKFLTEKELREKAEERSVLALRGAGYSDEHIAELLGISEDRVKAVRRRQGGNA